MKVHFLMLLYVLLAMSISSVAQTTGNFETKFSIAELQNAKIKLIPYPQRVTWGNEMAGLSEALIQNVEKISDPIQTELKSILKSANITLKKDADWSVDFIVAEEGKEEGYSLEISGKRVTIKASTEKGRFYALQTLRQLIIVQNGETQICLCTIEDWPSYPIRGYMLDVGRNFQSIASLKKQIDIMARYKMNTFHWHLTDRPAWRIESIKYPELTDSANHIQTRNPGKFYTYNEIRELFVFARLKQVTIIPEIDMPGHSDSFKKSMGATMQSEKGMQILENVLKEFFSQVSTELCPYIHIGSDEVHIANPNEFITKMVNICQQHNRRVIIWNPGLSANNYVIRQTWIGKDVTKGNYQEIDSWNSYVNDCEPMTQVSRLFFKPIGYKSENEVIGGILCLWPDVKLAYETDAFSQNPFYPSLLTYAWKTWTADITQTPNDYCITLPDTGTDALNYYSQFEDFLLYHKEKYFGNEPFPYLKQADKPWKIIGPFDDNDGDKILATNKETYSYKNKEITWQLVTGNTLVFNDRYKMGGYFREAEKGQTAYACTWIYSEKEMETEAWIGFETPLRANRIYTGIPEAGKWDPNGGNIWINDKPVPPPVWQNPGWKTSKQKGWGEGEDQEIPWGDEELYWTRRPSIIHLQKGWNKVFVKVPCTTNYQNWEFTFVPLSMDGLRYSTNPTER